MAELDETTPAESTESTEASETAGEIQPEAAPSESGESPAESSETEEQPEELDAEKLRAELAATRKEAAKYRTKARELNEALSAAKTPEEFQAVADRATMLETDLHRERLARKYNLPEALAARITGDDEESRDADAKALSEVVSVRNSGVGSGGLNPSAKSLPTDPRELARMVPRGRR